VEKLGFDSRRLRLKRSESRRLPPKLDHLKRMEKSVFYYVYVLESKVDTAHFYTGFTENPENRLKDHNSGKNPNTTKHKPWRIKTAIAFTNRQKSWEIVFGNYL
jgi:predicted GIY-YIG superfamily endonuclease